MKNTITNQLQLDFFKPIAEEVDLSQKANLLLEALNDGLKKKEMYEPTHYTQFHDLIILIAENKEKDRLFNVIDIDGKTPNNFSANWRSANHVKQDLLENIEN